MIEAALDPGDLNGRLARALASACGAWELATDAERVAGFKRLSGETQAVRDACLRRAFENAWKLGRSARRRFGAVTTPEAWARLFEQLPSLVCTAGRWSSGPEGSWEVHSLPCRATETFGPLACELFREAADGLVCGLGDRVRIARLTSTGRGGDGCWSRVFFREQQELGWRHPAKAEREQLFRAAQELARRGVALEVLGLLEDRVIYRLAPTPESGGRMHPLAEAWVENVLSRMAPGLRALSARPRRVLSDFG